MNKNTINAIGKKLGSILENLKDPFTLGDTTSKTILYNGKIYAFTDDHVQIYNDVLKTILKFNNFNQRFSEKYIDNELKKILNKVISEKNYSNLTNYLESLIEFLNTYNIKRNVILPLVGLQLNIDIFKIGKLTIRKFQEEDAKILIKEIENIIDQTKNSIEQKNHYKKLQSEIVNNNFKNFNCAEMSVIAEPERASERIVEEARNVIDIIYFSIPALHAENKKVHIGLVGEFFQAKRFINVLSESKDSFDLKMVVTGPLVPFEISDESISLMKDLGIFKLSEIIEKNGNEINSFEEVLLRGVHWFASAQKQEESENRLLNLITTIETFLTPKDGNPIGTAIAEGTAILLSTGLENRKKMKKRVQELYRLRSAVSHGGKKNIFNTDVKELLLIVANLIRVLIDFLDAFSTHKDLFDFIEAKKLGN